MNDDFRFWFLVILLSLYDLILLFLLGFMVWRDERRNARKWAELEARLERQRHGRVDPEQAGQPGSEYPTADSDTSKHWPDRT